MGSGPTDTLPTGLSLNPSTGEISGTPTQVGTATFVARVTSGSQYTEKAISIVVGNVLGRWIENISGTPITSSTVGSTVHLQLCYIGSDMAAFQSTLSNFAANANVLSVNDFDSGGSGVPGVHPDCAGTIDVLDDGPGYSGTADPLTFLMTSNSASGGTGPTGIIWLEVQLASAGTLQMDLGPMISSDFSGSSLTLWPAIDPLTIN